MFALSFALYVVLVLMWAQSWLAQAQYTMVVDEGYRASDGAMGTSLRRLAWLGYPGSIHCNPVQVYSDLPANGGVLQDFYANFVSSGTTVNSYIRPALYQVSNGTIYTLLASTNPSSDFFVPTGSYTSAQAAVSSGPRSLYYPGNATSLTVYPNISYAICFHSTGAQTGQITQQLGWLDSSSREVLVNYSISNPMPSMLSITSADSSDVCYQMWITLNVNTSTPPVVAPQPTGLQLGWMTAPAGVSSYPGSVGSYLRCDNVQQFNALPATGYRLSSFSVIYNPALTLSDGGIVRMALYTVSGGTYTLVAGTNASSDLQLPQGPVLAVTVTSRGPLYYPSGSSYNVLPNTNYALCFYNNDNLLAGAHVDMNYFVTGTSNAILAPTYNLSQSLPVTATAVSTTANSFFLGMNVAVPAGGVGDPQFVGLRGQSYQVHGIDGAVYNLISERNVQVNARFVFLTEGKCPIIDGTPTINCWSHPGSYMGELSFQQMVDGKLHAALITSGDHLTGFASVQVDGEEVHVNDRVQFGAFSVEMINAYAVHVSTEHFDFVLDNSDRFINQGLRGTVPLGRLRSHGLLGQTHSTATYPNALKYVEGEVDDYTIADSNIFGNDFVFNRFHW